MIRVVRWKFYFGNGRGVDEAFSVGRRIAVAAGIKVRPSPHRLCKPGWGISQLHRSVTVEFIGRQIDQRIVSTERIREQEATHRPALIPIDLAEDDTVVGETNDLDAPSGEFRLHRVQQIGAVAKALLLLH